MAGCGGTQTEEARGDGRQTRGQTELPAVAAYESAQVNAARAQSELRVQQLRDVRHGETQVAGGHETLGLHTYDTITTR